MSAYQVVTPYRPFPPESDAHHALGPFDWIGAIEMLTASVTRACGCATTVITDIDTVLPVPAWPFVTHQRRLMAWMLEIVVRFLESPQFDRDTVMVCPDTLVFDDLARFFAADLGVVVRTQPKYADRPVLNGVQWWRHRARHKLIAFYTRALAIASELPEDLQVWGGDSEPIRQLIDPISAGVQVRGGLRVVCWPETWVEQPLDSGRIAQLEAGETPAIPSRPILDFRYTRKRWMRTYFDRTIGSAVAA